MDTDKSKTLAVDEDWNVLTTTALALSVSLGEPREDGRSPSRQSKAFAVAVAVTFPSSLGPRRTFTTGC